MELHYLSSLTNDKVIPEAYAQIWSTLSSYDGGDGYEVLWGIVQLTHPNYGRKFLSCLLIYNRPVQQKNEKLEYHLCLKTFMTNTSTSVDNPDEIANLIQGMTHSYTIFEKTNVKWDSKDQETLKK